jgi:hypothetical protein
MKTKPGGGRRKKPSKPYSKFDDVQRAEYFGVYCDSSADVHETYKALKRKVTKTALHALERDFHWSALYEQVSNKFMRSAVNEAVTRKKQTLTMLHNTKVRAYNSIVGDEEKGIAPVRAKTQGEAIESLMRVIEIEARMLGDMPMDEDKEQAETGLLRMVLERYMGLREKGETGEHDKGTAGSDIGIVVEVGTRKQ